jgi:hypothetical protein
LVVTSSRIMVASRVWKNGSKRIEKRLRTTSHSTMAAIDGIIILDSAG